MKKIRLTRGKWALVDDEDFESLNKHNWTAIQSAGTDRLWYAARGAAVGSPTKTIIMHRVIMKAPRGVEVDHRNCNGLDNRRRNLRLCTHAQNSYNARTWTKGKRVSKYKGVTWRDSSYPRYRASIHVLGKKIHLGYFSNETDAARAYDAAARKHFGEFARTNFRG